MLGSHNLFLARVVVAPIQNRSLNDLFSAVNCSPELESSLGDNKSNSFGLRCDVMEEFDVRDVWFLGMWLLRPLSEQQLASATERVPHMVDRGKGVMSHLAAFAAANQLPP